MKNNWNKIYIWYSIKQWLKHIQLAQPVFKKIVSKNKNDDVNVTKKTAWYRVKQRNVCECVETYCRSVGVWL
jgi:hypothetical protein